MNNSGFEARISEALGNAKRQQIAEILGVNYQTLSNWLNGRAEFPIKALAEIANRSDYSLNWIVTGRGEKRTAKPEAPSVIDMHVLTDLIRQVARQEISNLRYEMAEPEEDVRIEPAEMMLAPVVAHIGPGKKLTTENTEDTKDQIRKSLVSQEGIEEMERRLKVKKRKTG